MAAVLGGLDKRGGRWIGLVECTAAAAARHDCGKMRLDSSFVGCGQGLAMDIYLLA